MSSQSKGKKRKKLNNLCEIPRATRLKSVYLQDIRHSREDVGPFQEVTCHLSS
jgi:hypothetical protein